MSGEAELFTLLKGVSRSFYHQCAIPSETDSTGDSPRLSVSPSVGHHRRHQSASAGRTNRVFEPVSRFLSERQTGDPIDLSACLSAQADGPERVLLANIDRVLEYLPGIPPAHRKLLNEVLAKIIHGQTLDIETI